MGWTLSRRAESDAGALTHGQAGRLKTARWLARAMDTRWAIGPFRFGAEAFLDFIPIIGDLISLAVSIYQFGLALELTVPRPALARMLVNVGIDTFCGTLPVVGDMIDTAFRVHARNQRIIDDYLHSGMASAAD